MELRDWAERILLAETLHEKLSAPDSPMTDERPGAVLRLNEPARPDKLRILRHRRGAKMPKLVGMHEPRLRAVAHHIMANHELQALEVMAWTLCAFPDAPSDFRAGLINVMLDEQRHTKMHVRRLRSLGIEFGSLPVNGHVWVRSRQSENILDYLACLPLTFEGGNLDHSIEFAAAFDSAGDAKSRDIMLAIHDDEIEHVAFGVEWFRKLKPTGLTEWEAYVAHLRWPMYPARARGNMFQREARLRAGMTEDFVDKIALAKEWPIKP